MARVFLVRDMHSGRGQPGAAMKTTLASARKLAAPKLAQVARAQVAWWVSKLGADTPLDDIQPRDIRRHL